MSKFLNDEQKKILAMPSTLPLSAAAASERSELLNGPLDEANINRDASNKSIRIINIDFNACLDYFSENGGYASGKNQDNVDIARHFLKTYDMSPHYQKVKDVKSKYNAVDAPLPEILQPVESNIKQLKESLSILSVYNDLRNKADTNKNASLQLTHEAFSSENISQHTKNVISGAAALSQGLQRFMKEGAPPAPTDYGRKPIAREITHEVKREYKMER